MPQGVAKEDTEPHPVPVSEGLGQEMVFYRPAERIGDKAKSMRSGAGDKWGGGGVLRGCSGSQGCRFTKGEGPHSQPGKLSCFGFVWGFFFFFFFGLFFFFFFWALPRHMEGPRLGGESEL